LLVGFRFKEWTPEDEQLNAQNYDLTPLFTNFGTNTRVSFSKRVLIVFFSIGKGFEGNRRFDHCVQIASVFLLSRKRHT
jgi:hypothetical protein